MINPTNENWVNDDSQPATPSTGNFRATDIPGRAPGQGTTETAWEQTKEKMSVARERTEFFLRENPVPTIIGALAVGLAIGLAIRYSSSSDERPAPSRIPLADADWTWATLPFLWPFFKSVKRRYEDSTDVVKDGVDRIRNVDVDRYVKPLRKRWNSWTS